MENNSTNIEEPPVTQEAYTCPKCGKSFGSTVALQMHKMRVHTRAGRRGARWKQNKNKRTPEQRARIGKAMRAIHQRKQVPTVQFCPRCGCNIKAVETAVRFSSATNS